MRIYQSDYFQLTENGYGICLACHETTDGCEPDARKRECPSCGKREVYGIEEALIMGKVDVIEDRPMNDTWCRPKAKQKRVSAKDRARHQEPFIRHIVVKDKRIISRFEGRLSLGNEYLKAFRGKQYQIVTETVDRS